MIRLLGLLFFLSLFLHGAKFQFDIRFNDIYHPKLIYDALLPILLRHKVTNPHDPDIRQIETLVRHINFYATPGRYQRFDGLGTNGMNFENASLMLASGNMLCSEQSTIVIQAFASSFKQSRLDVVGHTNGELFVDNRWIIIDPMFDMRIKNRNALPASMNDINAYLAGDETALRLPKKLLPRTKQYLALYQKENFRVAPDAPRKTHFGNRRTVPLLQKNVNLGIHPEKMIQALKQHGIDINQNFTPEYLLIYIIPNIIYLLEKAEDPQAKADFIQDVFLAKIRQYYQGEQGIAAMGMNLYLARQYQLLQRYPKALEILDRLTPNEQVLFYKAQIYFKQGDEIRFLGLKKALEGNIYYRYLYYQMRGEFLKKDDRDQFANFPYRHMGYDQ